MLVHCGHFGRRDCLDAPKLSPVVFDIDGACCSCCRLRERFTEGLLTRFAGWTKRKGESLNARKGQLLLLLNVSVPATPCLKVKVHHLISPPQCYKWLRSKSEVTPPGLPAGA